MRFTDRHNSIDDNNCGEEETPATFSSDAHITDVDTTKFEFKS